MQGFQPKLPLKSAPTEGYSMASTAIESIKQDLKNLVLTNPGERVMQVNYGVGLRKYIFTQPNEILFEEIKQKIKDQVKEYMSFINIEDVLIIDNEDNTIGISIIFNVPYLGTKEALNL